MTSFRVRAWALAAIVGAAVSTAGCASTVGSDSRADDFKVVTLYYGTDRAALPADGGRVRYGKDRGDQYVFETGVCSVSIPRDHRTGERESPLWFFPEDPQKHIVVQGVERLDPQAFSTAFRSAIAQASRKAVLVFVHGYRTDFDEAARQAAQVTYDLGFRGVPAFFSWPSNDALVPYVADESDAEWAVPHLSAFLEMVQKDMQPEEMFVIAHSMGTRVLARAVKEMAAPPEGASPRKFTAIILAAPDIDRDVFYRDLAPRLGERSDATTLYASGADVPLFASGILHGAPRAGDAPPAWVAPVNVDTVDASGLKTDFFGHSYWAQSGTMLWDIDRIVNGLLLRAEARRLVPKVAEGGGTFWILSGAGHP
jgi:esterase/lipase superfamily enzyme